MHWTQDSLWNKSKLYMDRAIAEERNGPIFPFWCSLALEVLARSTIALISPTLLAEPDKDQTNLLYALGKGTPKKGPISIKASQVFTLCKQLVPNFTSEEFAFCESLSHLRNEELHSGGIAFDSLPNGWLTRFYATSDVLLCSQKRNLNEFLGPKEAAAAIRMIEASKQHVLEKVKKSISAHKVTFEEKPKELQTDLLAKSESLAKKMVSKGGHRIVCPACGAKAWVTGEEICQQEAKIDENEIIQRTSMLPTVFECASCDLKLLGHAELQAADVGAQFTRSIRSDIIDFYGDYSEGEEYNNE